LKKQIKQIFLIPILFLLFGLIAFGAFYAFFIEDLAKEEFTKVNNIIIKNEKEKLQKNLKSIINAIDGIRVSNYKTSYEILNEMLKVFKKDYLSEKPENIKNFINHHKTENMFLYIISKNTVYPLFYQNFVKIGTEKYIIVHYKGNEFLCAENRINQDSVIGIAYKLDNIENMIKKEIIDFIGYVNKNTSLSFVFLMEVTDWDSTKGVFARIIYHPVKSLIGKKLKIDEPDIKGKYYRKKYIKSLKTKNDCFVSYYFINPKSGKYEPFFSYFTIYRPYNYILEEGFYYSQIIKDIKNVQKDITEDVEELMVVTFVVLIVFVFISFILAYFISKRIMKQTLSEYEKLKNDYEKSKQELIERVYYDKLTGLPNRNKLLDDIESFNSLCLVDIDDFSNINGILGFETGDKVLMLVSEFLKKNYKFVYRIGSDEFAIGFNYKIKEDDLKKLIKLDIKFNDIKINFTAGASNIKNKLIETAETALKQAYKDKTLKYKIYEEIFFKEQKEKLEKLQQLLTVMEKKDVVPYYHCIVNNKKEVIKYEALMRLKYNDKILSPFEFMDLIKEFKLYHNFSRIMIEKVFQDLQKFNNIPVSINLSFFDISNEETKNFICKLLDQYPQAKVIFEILETESIVEFDKVLEFITHVKRKGVKIAIDDFGSGYSNFVNILYLKPDFLKIDASLVKNINNPMYYEIVKLMVNFAKKFNIETVAEFVSDEEKFEILKEMGVDQFQGFYFCKPRPIDELI